jgi:predicted CoA-binding protein
MKVLVIGASIKEERYSNKAIKMLNQFDHDVLAIGLRNGMVDCTFIIKYKDKENFENIDTVTLYLNTSRQAEFYDYIINLNPRRVIFNPGTENTDLYHLLDRANINYENSCTLVLLQSDLF